MELMKQIREIVGGKSEQERGRDTAYMDMLAVLKNHFSREGAPSYTYSFSGDESEINYEVLNRLRQDNWSVGAPEQTVFAAPCIFEVEISNPPEGFSSNITF